MSVLVIDASVAVKWFIAEDRSDAALQVRDRDAALIAPASAVYEIFHALWHAARTGRIPPERLAEAEGLVTKPFASLAPVEPLFAPAARLALTLAHPIYDCVYLALADRTGAELVTADERLFAAARKARIKAMLL